MHTPLLALSSVDTCFENVLRPEVLPLPKKLSYPQQNPYNGISCDIISEVYRGTEAK